MRKTGVSVVPNRFGIRPIQRALQGTSIPERFGTRQFDLLGRLPLAADRGYYGPVLFELVVVGGTCNIFHK